MYTRAKKTDRRREQGQGLNIPVNETQVKPIRAITVEGRQKQRRQKSHHTGLNTDNILLETHEQKEE